MDNTQLITLIKQGDDAVIQEIYAKYRDEFIIWGSKNYQCGFEEGKELFQQCMVQLYENVVNEKLTVLSSDLKTYLFGIGKNKIKELRETERKRVFERDEQVASTEERVLYESVLDRVEGALSQLGDPCKKLLELFYYRKMSLSQITDRLDYKNTDTTKTLKYKCLGRLRRIYTSNA